MKRFFFLLVTTVLTCAYSEETFVVPRTGVKPVTDGVIRKDEYKYGATFVGAANYRAATMAGKSAVADKRQAECAVTWDEDYLYIATRSKTGKDGYLPKGGPKANAFSDESIELWFNPPKEIRKAEFSKFGQFKITVGWTGKYDLMHHNPGYGYSATKWKAEGIIVKNAIIGEYWDCEIAIPASAFGAKKLDCGKWGVVLGRNFWTEPRTQCTFAPFNSRGGYEDVSGYTQLSLEKNVSPTRFNGSPKLVLSEQSVTVPGNITMKVVTTGVTPPKTYRRFFSSQNRGHGYFGLQEVANPDGTVHMTMYFHDNKRNVFKNFVHNTVPKPGDETVISLNVFEDRIVYYLDGDRIGEIAMDVPLKSGEFGDYSIGGGQPGVDVKSIHTYSRTLAEEELKIAAQGDKSIAGDLKWYASQSLIACSLSFPKPAGKSEYPIVAVFDENLKKIQETRVPQTEKAFVITKGKFPVMVVHDKVSLGKVPDGKYRMVLYAGKKREKIIDRQFIVKQYEWFNTKVGTQDILLPGFTPVQAKGNSVSTVGRKYVFGDNGLPKEIWSLDKQILARPVTLVNVPEKNGDVFKITKSSDTKANFTANMVKGRVEQDGLIVMNINLPETQGDVSLDIPVKSQYAELFHACGVGIRINPAGFLPEGKGRIFNSRKIPQQSNGNFIPYCWVGTDDRGICYAADSDKGWIHGKDKDAVEIHREDDGTVVIRLNLLNGKEKHSARKICVTLMASPVKPMPKGWRGWVDNYDVPAERNTMNNASNPTWGCYIRGMARYATFMDWEYVRKMSDCANTGKVDDAYVEAWIARCMKAYHEKPEMVPWLKKQASVEAAQKTLRAHAFAAFRRPATLHNKKNRVFYYYTCDADPCDGLYELPVMKDEWGSSTSVYGSHADYAIFYLHKMCKNGMTGVYNDNAFFHCNYDWVTGDAWIDENGEVHPSMFFWALREFCRRQIVAMLEAGVKDPWLTIHHTNANILPAMSFATNTMGMEWKYGRTEYQDRFSPDYIRTVNQGLQGGFFPTSLEGLFDAKDAAEKTHITRTMLAALLTHEIQPTLSQSGDHKLVLKALGLKQKFGVGKDDCVYNAYYDKGNPVVQPRKDVMISTYRRGKELLLVIGSYADEDVAMELKLKHGNLVSAVNAEDDSKISVKNGKAAFTLKRRDFAMIKATID